jgi:hypothetical protein
VDLAVARVGLTITWIFALFAKARGIWSWRAPAVILLLVSPAKGMAGSRTVTVPVPRAGGLENCDDHRTHSRSYMDASPESETMPDFFIDWVLQLHFLTGFSSVKQTSASIESRHFT